MSPWRVTFLCTVISCALLLPFEAAEGMPPPTPGDDSVQAKLKACLLAGDVTCVVTQWMTLKGTDQVPERLSQFQKAFELTHRQAGRCVGEARDISLGLQKLGQRPQYFRITVTGEHRKILGFDEIVNGTLVRSHQLSTNGYHVAIRLDGRIIDA